MAQAQLKVVHCGLGPIGQGIARLVLETEGLQVVGATDLSPDQAGKDLGAVLGLPAKLRVKVDGDPERFVRKTRADVAVLSTSSSLKAIKPQVAGPGPARHERRHHLRGAGLPHARPRQRLFRELDKAARGEEGLASWPPGVNPGYAMDALALMLTAPCAEVSRVLGHAGVDAGTRRLPLQRKVGAGPQPQPVPPRHDRRHRAPRGPAESVHMIAAAPGLEARPGGGDARAGHRAARPRHRVPAHPRRRRRGIKQYARGYRDGELADQPRPADVRGRRVAARPRAHRRHAAHRHDDRGRRRRRRGHRRHRA